MYELACLKSSMWINNFNTRLVITGCKVFSLLVLLKLCTTVSDVSVDTASLIVTSLTSITYVHACTALLLLINVLTCDKKGPNLARNSKRF